MIEHLTEFNGRVAAQLPETYALLQASNLTIHPQVFRITLHGSRGPAGGYRPDSDIDLCLLVNTRGVNDKLELGGLLEEALQTTLVNWQGPVEADLAAVYDRQGCGLKCFECETFDESECSTVGTDCFGLYKVQKGFSGFVVNAGVRVRRMLPCLKIWERGN
jgi:hypothetical protein